MHLVSIVSRESERLNHIITDFLNYSREKTYEFQKPTSARCLNETLTLIEKKPEIGSKYQISRAFNGHEMRARVDPSKIKQVFWNLCDNALRAMPDGGTLTVGLEERPFWVRIAFPRHGHRAGCQAARQDFRAVAIGISGRHRAWALDRVSDCSGAQRKNQRDFAERPRRGIYRGIAAGSA